MAAEPGVVEDGACCCDLLMLCILLIFYLNFAKHYSTGWVAGIILSTSVYHRFCLKVLWLLFVLLSDTQSSLKVPPRHPPHPPPPHTHIVAHDSLCKFCDLKPTRLMENPLKVMSQELVENDVLLKLVMNVYMLLSDS